MSDQRPVGKICDADVFVRDPDEPWPSDTRALVIPEGPISVEILRDAIGRFRQNYGVCRSVWITPAQHVRFCREFRAKLDPPVTLPPNVIDMSSYRKR